MEYSGGLKAVFMNPNVTFVKCLTWILNMTAFPLGSSKNGLLCDIGSEV